MSCCGVLTLIAWFGSKIKCLLFQNFNAKLSDFGLAKLGPVNGNSHVTTRVMGTYGYAAPEYVATGNYQNFIYFIFQENFK